MVTCGVSIRIIVVTYVSIGLMVVTCGEYSAHHGFLSGKY